jgi:hypothetical protein
MNKLTPSDRSRLRQLKAAANSAVIGEFTEQVEGWNPRKASRKACGLATAEYEARLTEQSLQTGVDGSDGGRGNAGQRPDGLHKVLDQPGPAA